MQKKSKTYFIMTGMLFLTFIVFTVLVKTIDVKSIGPQGSAVGFAAINEFFFVRLGTSPLWYQITSWLGFVALVVAFGFAVFGLYQLLESKDIRKVDQRILLLGAFYFIVLVFYVLFELVIVNYRPVILCQELEASYPSSHTMLVVCIMVTAMVQFHHYLKEKERWLLAGDILSVLIIAVTVVGRLLSGVHWFTDIIAGMILSVALILLYCSALKHIEEKQQT